MWAVELLSYEAELVGIRVLHTKERCARLASFLDGDLLPVYGAWATPPDFSGRGVRRGLYQAADGRRLNADANGSCSIMRRVAPEIFAQGSSGCVAHPI